MRIQTQTTIQFRRRALIAVGVVCVSVFAVRTPVVALDDDQPVAVSIVDSSGDPLSGVQVYWFRNGKAKKILPNDGKLTVRKPIGLIVAQKDGFQFGGAVLDNLSSNQVSIVMRSSNEPGPVRKTRPMPIGRETRQKILDQIEEVCWQRVQDNPEDQLSNMFYLSLVASISPHTTMDYLTANPLDPQYGLRVQQALVKSLIRSDFESAVELAGSTDDPMIRQAILFPSLTQLPSDSPHLTAIETQLVDTVRAIPQPQLRLAVWGGLAQHYLSTGRPTRAQTIVDDQLEKVKKLPAGGWSGYPRSQFAALVVFQDPTLAQELIKGIDATGRSRALGRVAYACCLTDPELALELLGEINNGANAITTSTYHIRVIDRMAAAQPDAAFQLADSIDEPNQGAWAFGLIAMRLKDQDHERSRIALDKAIAKLQSTASQTAGSKTESGNFSPATTMAGLLPFAESVSPEQVDSMIWQAVWLSIPKSRWHSGGLTKQYHRQNTAAAIMRYDESIARALFGDRKLDVGINNTPAALQQLAFAPDEFSEMLKSLRAASSFGNRLWEELVQVLQSTDGGREFWDANSLPMSMAWPAEKFEDH